MSVLAYQKTQRTESPRQTEYRLFARVTKSLMDADRRDSVAFAKAVAWNRRLWLTLQADCANDANALPRETRAGIISLSLWVERYSRTVLHGEAPLEPLITVNRTIMEGLAGAGQQLAAAG